MTPAQNTQIVIATFEDFSAARQAKSELENSGIAYEDLNLDSNQKTVGAGSEGYREQPEESGFAGWWHSLFGSDEDNSERTGYETALNTGRTILRATVPAQSVDDVVDILNRQGAVDVDEHGAGQSEEGSRDAGRRDAGSAIPVVEEELQVGKRAVRRGGVRVYSRVVSTPAEEQVTLRDEHVTVERRPVDRELSPGEASALRDQTIEVEETAEEAVIRKRARVREEVVVNKEATDRTETVRDNVRHTEVEVEKFGEEKRTAGRTARERGSELPEGKRFAEGTQSQATNTGRVGTFAGEKTGSAVTDLGDFSSDYRRDFESNYGPDADFESMRPAYEYGYRSAGDKRYEGKPWYQVENDLRADYEGTYPESRWEHVKNAVRYGWDRIAGAGKVSNPADSGSQEHLVPVIEEELIAGTRVVRTGSVRVRKKVHQVSGQVETKSIRDVVSIERVAVNRPVESVPSVREEGDTLIIPVVEEEVVLQKRLVLKEEIHVLRRKIEDTVKQPVTLEYERATVERLDSEGNVTERGGPEEKSLEQPGNSD